MQQYAMTGEPPPPMPARVSAWSVYDVFKLADGELFVGAVQRQAMADAVQGARTARPRQRSCAATNEQRVSVRPGAARAARRSVQPAQRRRHGVKARGGEAALRADPAARAAVRRSPSARERRTGADADGGGHATEIPLLPLMMDGRRLGVQRPLPRVGEHTDEMLREVASATRDAAGANKAAAPRTTRRK